MGWRWSGPELCRRATNAKFAIWADSASIGGHGTDEKARCHKPATQVNLADQRTHQSPRKGAPAGLAVPMADPEHEQKGGQRARRPDLPRHADREGADRLEREPPDPGLSFPRGKLDADRPGKPHEGQDIEHRNDA